MQAAAATFSVLSSETLLWDPGSWKAQCSRLFKVTSRRERVMESELVLRALGTSRLPSDVSEAGQSLQLGVATT